jgi:hypothetical protein
VQRGAVRTGVVGAMSQRARCPPCGLVDVLAGCPLVIATNHSSVIIRVGPSIEPQHHAPTMISKDQREDTINTYP